MNRFKSLLEKYENGYLFPYSRIVWILASVIFITGTIIFSSLYLFNSIPNSRKDVHISREELRRKKVILEEDLEKFQECSKSAYDKQIDSLRKMSPRSEWKKLFSFVDDYEYVEVRKYQPGYYDPWSGYQYDGYFYDDYDMVKVKRKVDNDTAYPVILNSIFNIRGIDSAYFCEKIKDLNLLIELHKRVPSNDATYLMKNYFSSWVGYSTDLERDDIKQIYFWMDKIEGKKIILGKSNKIRGNKRTTLEVFSNFMSLFCYDSVSVNQIKLVDRVIDLIKASGFKDVNSNYNILTKVLGSSLKEKDLEIAISDYFDGKLYKKKSKSQDQDFNNYMRLFNKKVAFREAEKSELERARKNKVDENRVYAIFSFLGILQIVIILTLFSIQRVIKDRK